MINYTPEDWYWTVGADTERVYSSAQAAYVPATDAAYRAWAAGDTRTPTRIPNEEELHDVLTGVGVSPNADLGTAAQKARAALAGGTVILTCAAAPSLNGTYSVGPEAQADIVGLQAAVAAGVTGDAIPYPDASGVEHVFTPAQFTAFATAAFRYVLALKRCARGAVPDLPSSDLTI
jgi:hypothetical protein